MSDPNIILRTKFRRNMKLADYEMAEAEVAIEQEFPGDMAPEDVQAHVAGMFQYAKASVYDQLGLAYDQDEATGLIMEVFAGAQRVASKPASNRAEAPKTRKAATAPKSIPEPYTDDEPPVEAYDDEAEEEPPARPARRQAPARGSSSRPSAKAKGKAMTEDELWEHLEANPGEWYDNRETKTNPKAPDYRAKNIPDPRNPQFKAGLYDNRAPDWFENPFD